MNTSHEDNGMSVSGEDVSVLPSSVKAVNTSLPDTTPVLSLTTSVASHPDSGHGGTNSVPRVPVKNESQTKDRVAARDVSNTNKNTLTPPSLSTATKPYPSTRVTGKSAASSNAAMPRFGLQSNTANKSATSPTIRLGLSRNARVPPLHPRPLIRTQNLT